MILAVAAALVSSLAGAAWALGSPALPATPRFDFAWDTVRAAATRDGTAHALEVERVAFGAMPAFIGTAWGGLAPAPRVFSAFRVRTSAGDVVIDAPHPEALHALVPGGGAYDGAADARVQRALEGAAQIVITHAHGDHVAGVAHGDAGQTACARLRLNPKQRALLDDAGMPDAPSIRNMGFPAARLAKTAHLRDAPFEVIAPGVAVIATPGHTPGHQVVYVATDAHEYLLLGDLVWTLANVDVGRTRPRLVSRVVIGEDADQVADQLAAVIALARAHPAIVLLPSHDLPAIDEAIAKGLLAPRFD